MGHEPPTRVRFRNSEHPRSESIDSGTPPVDPLRYIQSRNIQDRSYFKNVSKNIIGIDLNGN